MNLIIATRPSPFARAQTAHVIRLLKTVRPDLKCQEQIIAPKVIALLTSHYPPLGKRDYSQRNWKWHCFPGK